MIVLNSDSAARQAIEEINGMPTDGHYAVYFGLVEDVKSAAQRSLAHVWLDLIGRHTGNGLYGEKEIVKERLPFAYTAGSGRIKLLVDWLCKTFPELEKYRGRMMKMPLKERSSESYNKKEYREFMDAIQDRAAEVDVNLPN